MEASSDAGVYSLLAGQQHQHLIATTQAHDRHTAN